MQNRDHCESEAGRPPLGGTLILVVLPLWVIGCTAEPQDRLSQYEDHDLIVNVLRAACLETKPVEAEAVIGHKAALSTISPGGDKPLEVLSLGPDTDFGSAGDEREWTSGKKADGMMFWVRPGSVERGQAKVVGLIWVDQRPRMFFATLGHR